MEKKTRPPAAPDSPLQGCPEGAQFDQLTGEALAGTSVEVSRVPIGRLIGTMPAIKEEGDLTIVPIVEETFVLERRLMLKEELHIRRVQTTERYQQTVRLRYQTAEVTVPRHRSRLPTASRWAAPLDQTQRTLNYGY